MSDMAFYLLTLIIHFDSLTATISAELWLNIFTQKDAVELGYEKQIPILKNSNKAQPSHAHYLRISQA